MRPAGERRGGGKRRGENEGGGGLAGPGRAGRGNCGPPGAREPPGRRPPRTARHFRRGRSGRRQGARVPRDRAGAGPESERDLLTGRDRRPREGPRAASPSCAAAASFTAARLLQLARSGVPLFQLPPGRPAGPQCHPARAQGTGSRPRPLLRRFAVWPWRCGRCDGAADRPGGLGGVPGSI